MCDERLGWFGQCDQKSSRIVARKRCSLLSACRQLVWVAKITAPGRLARSFRMKIAIPPHGEKVHHKAQSSRGCDEVVAVLANEFHELSFVISRDVLAFIRRAAGRGSCLTSITVDRRRSTNALCHFSNRARRMNAEQETAKCCVYVPCRIRDRDVWRLRTVVLGAYPDEHPQHGDGGSF